MRDRREHRTVLVLAAVLTALILTTLLAPFVLAAYFGPGWLALNYVTVPGYLLFCAWIDRRRGQ